MTTFVHTSSVRRKIVAKKSIYDSFAPVNYKWTCKRVNIWIGVSSRQRAMKRHNCFMPVKAIVSPARPD